MKKGFTLIELLAVIVILAIIALIATPIVLNIINDARESANERSVELYAASIEQAVAKYMLTNEVTPGIIGNDIMSKVEYSGSEVNCGMKMIDENGKIYLSVCTVGSDSKKYTYGEYQQVFKPDYYEDWSFEGDIGITAVPETPSTIPPESKNFYIGYDADNGIVSAAYICFERGNKYCLKGGSAQYETNRAIIEDAFSDVLYACSNNANEINCSLSGISAYATSAGWVNAHDDDNNECNADDGYFLCE